MLSEGRLVRMSASVRVGSSLDRVRICKILENIEFIVIPR